MFENLLVGTRALSLEDTKARAHNVRIYAFFYSNRGGIDEEFMLLPPMSSNGGWCRLVDNTVAIKIEYMG